MYYEDNLSELYEIERKKLEENWIFKQEAKLRIIKFKKDMLDKMKGLLCVSALLGREDITDEIKDVFLRDKTKGVRVENRLEKNMADEKSSLERQEKEELRSADYPENEYADYLFQLQKVIALEEKLLEEKLSPRDLV